MSGEPTFDGYKIVRRAIAHGSVGLVHEAVSPDGKRVAIKVLDREAIQKSVEQHMSQVAGHADSKTEPDTEDLAERSRRAYETNAERFKDEYHVLVGLKHPNVAEVYQTGFFENQLYIVSEFIEGKPIAEFVRGWKPVDMVPLFVQVLEGLDFIHRNGLIHLDIKSHNVLVKETNGKPVVKIIDFGMAMSPSEYKGAFMGTPSYIAPEVALGKRELVDPRTDLFSYGVLMYHCITWGGHPFARSKGDAEKVRRDIERRPTPDPPSYAHLSRPGYVPEYLDTITMRLLEYKPKDRFYGNARAVINALATKMPDAFSGNPETKSSYLRPMGDRHIGNEQEQAKVFAAINALADGRTPSPAMVEITGAQGTGKSHLLKKIREHAEGYAEKLAIKKIELPADETAMKQFAEDVTLWASENKLPTVILIDLDCHCERAAGERGNLVEPIIKNLINSISERDAKPELYAGIKPLMFVFTRTHSKIPSPLACPEQSRRVGEGQGEGESRTLTIKLNPFTPAELKEYLSSTPAFKGREVSDKKIAELHSLTGGIQAEVVEQLRESDSEGLIFSLDGEIVMSDLKSREKTPATTEARFQKTCESLQPEERRILDFLSVWTLKGIAPPPNFETISRMVSSPFIAVCMNNLIQSSVILSEAKNLVIYSFTNPYFSTFIYNRMAIDDRKLLHDRICAHMAMKGDDKDIVAFHRCHGSDKKEALRSVIRLGQKTLVRRGNVHLAKELFDHGLNLAASAGPKLFACLANLAMDAYQQAGCFTEADSLYERARNILTGQAGTRAWIILLSIRKAGLAIQRRKLDEADALLKKAGETLPKGGPTPLALAVLNYRARERYERAMTDNVRRAALLHEARGFYEQSMELGKKLPPISRGRILNNNLGLVLLSMGDHAGAIAKLGEKLALHKRAGDFPGILFSTLALAEAMRAAGDFDAAIRLAKEAVDLSKQTREGTWIWRAHHTLANVLHNADRFEEAIAENNACLSCSAFFEGEDEHRRTSVAIWVQKGHCYKELDRFDEASLHFQEVIAAGADPFSTMSAYEGLGETLFRQGKFSESIFHLDAAQKLLNAMPEGSAPTYRDSVRKFRNLAVESMKPSPQ